MLTENELLTKLKNGEDSFVERKSLNDDQDIIKSIVAFANSCPTNFPGVIFFGVKNTGELQTDTNDEQAFDNFQKKITKKLKEVYPPIYILQQELHDNNKKCLAITVPGSDQRPHFAGPSYIRKGSESIQASELQYDELIACRSSKVYEILKYKDKLVTLKKNIADPQDSEWRRLTRSDPSLNIIDSCNQFYLTLKNSRGLKESIPIKKIEISFDHINDRLTLIV